MDRVLGGKVEVLWGVCLECVGEWVEGIWVSGVGGWVEVLLGESMGG